VWDRPNARERDGPRDQWYVSKSALPSAELFTIVWVLSTLLRLHQGHRREKRLAAAAEHLRALKDRLASARARLLGAPQINQEVAQILQRYDVGRYLKVRRLVREADRFKQSLRGRPGPKTLYTKLTRRRYAIEWELDAEAIAYDLKSDDMYPLLTNDAKLTAAQVLGAHKGQPRIEKRFEQLKTVHEIAPVFLKNEARIEALFTLYFLALLVQGLIERQLRVAMHAAGIEELPLYPEARVCRRPTTEQVLRPFSQCERITILARNDVVRVVAPTLTPLQRQLLELLGVPAENYLG
jgi:transposase